MTTVLAVALGLAVWTLLSIPLGVLVGRRLSGPADLTRVREFHTLEA